MRSPIRELASTVNPATAIAPTVAELAAALAVTPLAAALATIAPLIPIAVFPFSFGNQRLIRFGIF